MSGEHLLLFLENVSDFLLKSKVLLLVLVLHCFFHSVYIILGLFFLDVFLYFFRRILFLNVDLLSYLVVGLFFGALAIPRIGVAGRSVECFLN